MQDPPRTTDRRRGFRTNRLEAFSDGVFAIAITLLVLELGVPVGSEDDLLSAILAAWPSYLAFVVSFATVGAVWLAHSTITEYIDRADTTFIRINLLLLLVISFLPFPTRLVAEHISANEAERVAATFYGLNLMLAAVIMSVLWRHATRVGLIREDADDDEIRLLSERLTPGLAGYAILIAVGLLAPRLAVVGYLLIALFFLVPFRLPFGGDRRRRREHS